MPSFSIAFQLKSPPLSSSHPPLPRETVVLFSMVLLIFFVVVETIRSPCFSSVNTNPSYPPPAPEEVISTLFFGVDSSAPPLSTGHLEPCFCTPIRTPYPLQYSQSWFFRIPRTRTFPFQRGGARPLFFLVSFYPTPFSLQNGQLPSPPIYPFKGEVPLLLPLLFFCFHVDGQHPTLQSPIESSALHCHIHSSPLLLVFTPLSLPSRTPPLSSLNLFLLPKKVQPITPSPRPAP